MQPLEDLKGTCEALYTTLSSLPASVTTLTATGYFVTKILDADPSATCDAVKVTAMGVSTR
ncbi:hypothetical protein E2C01_046764 [Portunus trituberculatus]|uniref:Uncharacterized protein n=1 Tax=Portunus trituberculatus TaxID=210409 RepID=A0A5B7G5Y5_PORTR|nr:hypothetical protein [Portunus trituberculatus]